MLTKSGSLPTTTDASTGATLPQLSKMKYLLVQLVTLCLAVGYIESVVPFLGGLVGAYPQCFQCREKCISYSWRCDGEVDCYGAEDEAECEYICPYASHHRCSDTGFCIDNHHLCDGIYDCQNGEDESNCGGPWIGKHGAPIYEDKARAAKELKEVRSEESHELGEWTKNGFRSLQGRSIKSNVTVTATAAQ